MDRIHDSQRIAHHVVDAITRAPELGEPFAHLELENIFPADVYAAIVAQMPGERDYRPMSGRSKEARRDDGVPTRTKMDLLPEHIRHLRPEQRAVWEPVGEALCSDVVREAFRRRLAKGLEARFGDAWATVGMYAIPVLTRDVAGYQIGIHPDTRRKAMTIQLYLPRDESIRHVGTAFHRHVGPGKKDFVEARRMPFVPNVGYAFAVGQDTWHSVQTLGPEVVTRDSILLTYFVDQSVSDHLYNRGKRFGNFLLGEVRSFR
jgi:hypothetical protein